MVFLKKLRPLLMLVRSAAYSIPNISWEIQEKTRKNSEFLIEIQKIGSLNILLKFSKPMKEYARVALS